MAKISRPMVYAVVAAVAIYAIVLVTEPEKPAKKPTKRSSLGTSAKAPTGFLPEDMTAKFDRYQSKGRNPFQPEIMPKQSVINALPGGRMPGGSSNLFSALGLRGSWMLTGINTVDGNRSALIENSSSGDSAFLKTGDIWNGLEVVEIGTDAVVFLNSLGQRSQLKFVDPTVEPEVLPGVSGAPGTGTTPGGGPSRTIITVTPINKNGLNVSPGGVAPVVPTLPALTAPGAPGRQQ